MRVEDSGFGDVGPNGEKLGGRRPRHALDPERAFMRGRGTAFYYAMHISLHHLSKGLQHLLSKVDFTTPSEQRNTTSSK